MSSTNTNICSNSSFAPFIARVTVGLVMLPHGLQKTLGMFGGNGFEATMGFFTGTLGLPWVVALLVVLAESLGALALIVGLFTRFCALSLAIVMVGAVKMAHAQHGFFMNWFGAQQGEGYEYHLLVIGLCLSLLFSGAGKLSVDGLICRKTS